MEESGARDNLSDSNCEKQWRGAEIAEYTPSGREVLLGPSVTVGTRAQTTDEKVQIE